jgi:hypothetical protein
VFGGVSDDASLSWERECITIGQMGCITSLTVVMHHFYRKGREGMHNIADNMGK